MADYNAHTYFGMRVLEEMPCDQRRRCIEDLPVFRLGLYGPDPLIFGPKTKAISDFLHRTWLGDLPRLKEAIGGEDPVLRSFAAGYLLHQRLDEVIHGHIRRWVKTGSSHFRLELELDRQLLEELHHKKRPRLAVHGKERAAEAAAELFEEIDRGQYLLGLYGMAVVTDFFQSAAFRPLARPKPKETAQARLLRKALEETITSAAQELAEYAGA